MNRKDQFRSNLHEIAKQLGITKEQLAGELDLDPLNLTATLSEPERQTVLAQQRKWLYRLWEKGVDRENKNTVDLLQWLAKRLHLHHYKNMWSPGGGGLQKIGVDLELILGSPDGWTLRPSIEFHIKLWRLTVYVAAAIDSKPSSAEILNTGFERLELLTEIREILKRTDIQQRDDVIWKNILPELRRLKDVAEKRIKENPMLVVAYKERQLEKLRFEIELARATTPIPKIEPTQKPDLYQRLEQEYPAAFSIAVQRIGPEALKEMLEKSVTAGVNAELVLEKINKNFSQEFNEDDD